MANSLKYLYTFYYLYLFINDWVVIVFMPSLNKFGPFHCIGCQAHLCYNLKVSLEFSSTNFRAYFIYFKYVFVLCFILFRIFFRNLVNRALLFSISFSTFCIYNCFASISLSWQLMVSFNPFLYYCFDFFFNWCWHNCPVCQYLFGFKKLLL